MRTPSAADRLQWVQLALHNITELTCSPGGETHVFAGVRISQLFDDMAAISADVETDYDAQVFMETARTWTHVHAAHSIE